MTVPPETSPAQLVDTCPDADAARQLIDRFTIWLADERTPEPFRRDLQSRIADLHRRFGL